jgi:Cytochrome c554 and c-prime
MSRARALVSVLALSLSVMAGGACAGCKRTPAAPSAEVASPRVRVYVVSTLAGALEPCGCVKDMLGGVGHAAALTSSRRHGAGSTLFVAAGPTFFLDPELRADARDQDVAKAQAIADSLAEMGLAAWAPGLNDWAAGAGELARLRDATRASLLAANLSGASAGAQGTRVVEQAGMKIGIAGVSVPRDGGALPRGVESSDPRAALGAAEKSLDEAGASLKIALLAMPRGDALRVLDGVSGFQLAVVAKSVDKGDANDGKTPPMLLGDTLVVQTPNHLQAIAIVDFFVRGSDFHFKDGAGVADAEQRERLESRIDELTKRIARAEKPGSGVRAEDLGARRKELAQAKADLKKMASPQAPADGSFFRYEMVEVRESAGVEDAVAKRVASYYQKVNEHNRVAFADRKPPPVPDGESGYVGVEKCSSCHPSERKFWNGTAHAAAYAVLANQHKQFNLDCVGCHVTGYEKPGGSTVVGVKGLQNNQCENCHGPGSRHVDSPSDAKLIVARPEKSLCASECHHPPHVKSDWSVDEAWKKIVGPGHMKKK